MFLLFPIVLGLLVAEPLAPPPHPDEAANAESSEMELGNLRELLQDRQDPRGQSQAALILVQSGDAGAENSSTRGCGSPKTRKCFSPWPPPCACARIGVFSRTCSPASRPTSRASVRWWPKPSPCCPSPAWCGVLRRSPKTPRPSFASARRPSGRWAVAAGKTPPASSSRRSATPVKTCTAWPSAPWPTSPGRAIGAMSAPGAFGGRGTRT